MTEQNQQATAEMLDIVQAILSGADSGQVLTQIIQQSGLPVADLRGTSIEPVLPDGLDSDVRTVVQAQWQDVRGAVGNLMVVRPAKQALLVWKSAVKLLMNSRPPPQERSRTMAKAGRMKIMADEYQNILDRLTDLLDDDNIQVAIQEQDCVLTCGPVSALLKPDDRNRCLVIFQCPDWIYPTDLPVSWKPDRLPKMSEFLLDWTGQPDQPVV